MKAISSPRVAETCGKLIRFRIPASLAERWLRGDAVGLCCTTSLFFPSRFDSNQLSSGAIPRSDVKVPDVGFGFDSRICPGCFHAFYGSLIDVDYCRVSSWPP
ncbi:hypothetical protein BJV77DRAFT_947879 [Russula vinacea]|nr:hypothetical protein BJV77DRAFT_947879 [Russula vinacea]